MRGEVHWADFPSTLKSLNPNIEIEILEIPGNGHRCHETTFIDIEKIILDLRSHSKFVKTHQTFNLCGVSLGGMICLKWAEFFPEEISSVSIINSSLHSLSPWHYRLNPKNYKKIIRSFFSSDIHSREDMILGMTSNNPFASEVYLEKYVAFAKKFPLTKSNFLRQLFLASIISIDSPPSAPLKVICSIKDNLVNPSCSYAIAKKWGVPVIPHPSAGHDIPLDDPDWLAKILLN